MTKDARRFLFGPVQSRRLGVSLGVDLIPPKTCTLNCVYCECGATTLLTTERREYYPAAEIIAELDAYLAQAPKLDHITFGGSGEPTLNTGMGEILAFVKSAYPAYRTALLTNGTLFHLPEVRRDAMGFDVVLPSLDAARPATFMRINGPVRNLDLKSMMKGLSQFGRSYGGVVLLEVFIIEGINDTEAEIEAFRDAFMLIQPHEIQLNSLDRPGAVGWVRPARRERLEQIAALFAPLRVTIVARAGTPAPPPEIIFSADPAETVLSALRRRPLTLEEIARLVDRPVPEAEALLRQLIEKGTVSQTMVAGEPFFHPATRDG